MLQGPKISVRVGSSIGSHVYVVLRACRSAQRLYTSEVILFLGLLRILFGQ